MDIYAYTDKAILQQVGRKLKEARLEKNVSQKSLAEASGLSPFSISQMENGHNTSLLSIVMVLRALERFDVLEGLFTEKPLSPVAYSELMRKHPARKNAYTKGQRKRQEEEPSPLMAAEPADFNWDND